MESSGCGSRRGSNGDSSASSASLVFLLLPLLEKGESRAGGGGFPITMGIFSWLVRGEISRPIRPPRRERKKRPRKHVSHSYECSLCPHARLSSSSPTRHLATPPPPSVSSSSRRRHARVASSLLALRFPPRRFLPYQRAMHEQRTGIKRRRRKRETKATMSPRGARARAISHHRGY